MEIKQLYSIIEEKITSQEDDSYSFKLANEGVEKITRKIGEEAVEVIIAAFKKNQDNSTKNKQDLINEICDLIYHILVLAKVEKIHFSEIESELENRNSNKK
jgi:phosphoribosyl-ATP pyrophosphohydrolase